MYFAAGTGAEHNKDSEPEQSQEDGVGDGIKCVRLSEEDAGQGLQVEVADGLLIFGPRVSATPRSLRGRVICAESSRPNGTPRMMAKNQSCRKQKRTRPSHGHRGIAPVNSPE